MKLGGVLALTMTLVASLCGPAAAGEAAVGLKGGGAMTSIGGDFGELYDNKMGLVAGAYASYYFTEYVGIQAELLYVMKGATGTLYDDYYYYDVTISLDYIEVPFLLKARFPLSDTFAPIVFGGPAIAVNVRAEYSLNGYHDDIADRVSDLDLGLVVGAGCEILMQPLMLTGDLRYEIGILNINESVAFERNHGLTLMIGVGLSL